MDVPLSDAATAAQLRLLGGFSLLGPGGEAIEIVGQKDRALLAYLALSPGIAHGRDKLAALLWSDSGERQARDSLKQCLLRLRRTLATVHLEAIAGDRQTVALDVERIEVDAALFAQMAAGEDEVDRAITLYQGDLLDGLNVRAAAFEDWLLVERQRLRQLAIDSFSKSLAIAQSAGQRDRVAAAARRLLSLEPLQELACRALMQIHADRAERAQALKLFEALRDRLQQELGVKPEPETIRLYEAIKQQRAACSAAATVAPSRATTAAASTPAPAPQPSIAVLPFINGGDDPEQEYFADGLTEQIINDLSRISALSVIARHTVFAYKGKSLKVPEVARELGVGFVLEGSVRKSGGRLRVTAQLIDGGSGGHSWSMRYDRSLSDIFALQEEIAKTIVDVLKVRLLPAELESITSRSTANPAAYEYYLMGRSFYLRGIDRRNWRIARQMYAKACEIDPAYAAAYAGMAICDSHLLMGDPGVSPEAILVNSRRALELMPDLAEAHAATGLAHILTGRYEEADAAFARAAQLNPELFEAHFFWADLCQLRGLHDRATELFARAAELRPNDFRSLGLLATQYKDLGRLDDAMAASRRCLERVEAEIRLHPDNAGALAFGAITLAEVGQMAQAEDWAARAIIIGPDDQLVQYNVACALVMLGRLDTAVDHLERAFAASPAFRLWLSAWMRSDSDFDPLRQHPRFQALEERLQAACADGAAPSSHRPSIAVLPFVNLADDPEQDYFADGLTEDIITDLSQVSSLFVVARHTVYAYKGQDVSVERAAHEMKVRYVLEGSVRQEDRRMRVAVRLVDTGTGDHLWSNRYDRDIDDVFALQDEISKSIVDTLRVTLLPGEMEGFANHGTQSREAYDYYLLARSFYLRGMDTRSLKTARDLYGKACEIDPRYARALAGQAICESHLSVRDPNGAIETSLSRSLQALELAPNSAEARAAKGLAFYVAGLFADAALELDRAMSLDPNLFEAYFFAGRCRRILGRREQAAALFTRAAELRPNDYRCLGLLADECRALGRIDNAKSAERRCLERLAAEVKAHPENTDAWAFGSAILARLGEFARAAVWAQRALIMTPDDYLVLYNVARAHALMGNKPAALDRLDQAFASRPAFRQRLAAWISLDQDFESLRQEPRFRALEQRLVQEFPALS